MQEATRICRRCHAELGPGEPGSLCAYCASLPDDQQLFMSEAEICKMYREALNPARQIDILAQLNLTAKSTIIGILIRAGVYSLKDSHEERMRLYQMGYNDREIAKSLGISRVTVGNWRRRENLPAVEDYTKVFI